MAGVRQDHLGLCNEYGVPLDEFEQQFCARCLQPECSRSQYGTSRFEARVNTWEERLFKNPPRMAPDDPRFQNLASKKFLPIQPPLQVGPPGSKQAWIDPRDLDESPPEVQEKMVADTTPIVSSPDPTPDPEPPPAPDPAPTPQKAPPPKKAPKQLQVLNTPRPAPQMLKEAPAQPVAPAKDPWAAPAPASTTQPGEKIVQPGARIKLGGV